MTTGISACGTGASRLAWRAGGVAAAAVMAAVWLIIGCSASQEDGAGQTPVREGPRETPVRPNVTQDPGVSPDAGETLPGAAGSGAEPGGRDRAVWLEGLVPHHAEQPPSFPDAEQAGEAAGTPEPDAESADVDQHDTAAEPADTAAEDRPDVQDRPDAGAAARQPAVEPRILPDPEANSVIATVDGRPLTAADFVDRLFHMHYDWYLHFMRELYVDRVARLEAEAEGIGFDEAQIDDGFRRLVAFYQDRARRIGQSWRLHWQGLGYPSEQAYLDHLRQYVTRLMLLDRLVKLFDMRLTKVDFSQIVIPDTADRFTPDPHAKAQQLADRLQANEIEWMSAVRTHSADWKTAAEGGRQGRTPAGYLGVPAMDEFLFSAEPGDISDPIRHPMYGWLILKVNAIYHGREDATYASIRDEIESHFADGVPGLIQGRDTFLWLERILMADRYRVRTFAPLDPEGRPWIATILDEPVTANDLLQHAAQTNPDWTRQVITEVIVFHVAGLEAAREGIVLDEAAMRQGAIETLAHLKEATASRGEDFTRVWQRRGYSSEAAFRQAVIEPRVRESMQLERLVYLHDRRIERREIWHILCQSEALAQRARELIVDRGRSFQDAAAQYSQHRSTQEHGGRIGIVPRDLFSAEFSEAAFSLPVGEISEPVQTSTGWHVLLVTEVLPARPRLTWQQARTEIEAAIAEVPGIPGVRVPVSDTYRWIDAVQKTGRYEIRTHVMLGPQLPRGEVGNE